VPHSLRLWRIRTERQLRCHLSHSHTKPTKVLAVHVLGRDVKGLERQ
jgi:hypothetical protein